MDNIKKKIGNNLKRLRLEKGFKQSELAEIVGVEDKTISRIEVGEIILLWICWCAWQRL